jgi:hypothetical protein
MFNKICFDYYNKVDYNTKIFIIANFERYLYLAFVVLYINK